MRREEFQLTIEVSLYNRVAEIARQEHRRSVTGQMTLMLEKAFEQRRKLALQAILAPLPVEAVEETVSVRLYFSGELFTRLRNLALEEHRSLTKQIVYMLRLAVAHWPQLQGLQKWTDIQSTDIRRMPAQVPTAR